MQDIPLPGDARIRAGSKVIGTVIAANPARSNSGPELKIQFNKLILRGGKTIPITTSLRAIAS